LRIGRENRVAGADQRVGHGTQGFVLLSSAGPGEQARGGAGTAADIKNLGLQMRH